MKISGKGLWFWLHGLHNSDEHWELTQGRSASLCPYFWKGLLYLFSVLFFSLVVTAIITAAVLLLASSLLFITGPYTGYWSIADPYALVLLLFAIFGVGLSAWLDNSIDFAPKYMQGLIKRKNPTRKDSVTKTEAKPNVVVEYLKAKKAKMCPMIELEEES